MTAVARPGAPSRGKPARKTRERLDRARCASCSPSAWRGASAAGVTRCWIKASACGSPVRSPSFKAASGLFSLIAAGPADPNGPEPRRLRRHESELDPQPDRRDDHGYPPRCPRLSDSRDVAPAWLPPCKTGTCALRLSVDLGPGNNSFPRLGPARFRT